MNAYLNILLLAVIAVIFSGAFLFLSRFVGPHKPEPVKGSNFECGLPVEGHVLGKFSIKFYLVVILFLLFDLEVVFFYPWAIQHQDGIGLTFWLVEGLLFTVILLVGWVYVVKQRVLDWGARMKVDAQSQGKKPSSNEG
ncbi:MAG: NADH-quinone oxidoreductase subunit A [Myxococcales bacterium]|nr:NADH-quinone oxidoreductase subunit A [Myxococcales bacterium]